MSKAIILLASGVVSAAVAVAGAVAGMAGQLLKAAASTLFVGLLAVVLVIVAVAAIILLSGCGPTTDPGASPVPEQAARATATRDAGSASPAVSGDTPAASNTDGIDRDRVADPNDCAACSNRISHTFGGRCEPDCGCEHTSGRTNR